MENGDVFDSSVSRDPIKFEVGGGQVIPGIEEEVTGMNVEGKNFAVQIELVEVT